MYLVPEGWGQGDGGNLELFTTGEKMHNLIFFRQ